MTTAVPTGEDTNMGPKDKPEQDEQETPDGFPAAWLDPTDQHAVAAYIDQHGIEAFQKLRNEQVGTTYQ